jgi:DNA-binding transcriptional LysR family regulator
MNALGPTAVTRPLVNLNLGLLRAFVAVAAHGGFTKASAQLQVAQPTLSRHVQRLERVLQTRLFARVHQGVRLTAEGKILLAKAKRLLASADDLTATASPRPLRD